MTESVDLVLRNAEIHTLGYPDETAEAIAIREGEIVRVDSTYEVEFLAGVGTTVLDLDERSVIPGFVDAHTHMEDVGRREVHADLSGATSLEDALSRLEDRAGSAEEWIFGFGWDESTWSDDRGLRGADLDRVSDDRPVVAVRVDMHTATLNSEAMDRLRSEMPESDVETEDGEPTGVVVEDATLPVRDAIDRHTDPGQIVRAARDRAHELGVTCVHEKVRNSRAPRVYRDLEADGELHLRVRLDYWTDHLDALDEVGLPTNHGSDLVEVGAIKTFTDGSLGASTAKLSEPYVDGDGTGQWVVDPAELEEIVEDAEEEDRQLSVHAIGDRAIEETVAALEDTDDPEGSRHRIEHVELATDDAIERMAEAGIVASCQPNFHRWTEEGGLYDRRLGEERRKWSNRLGTFLDAGVPLAFGSDCMPFDPLLGIHHAVNAPTEAQRLTVTEALRAYTHGSAYAGFDETRLGTLEAGKLADLVVLEESPWDVPSEEIRDIDVAMTIVGGTVVYDAR